jgi:hypothetical protein
MWPCRVSSDCAKYVDFSSIRPPMADPLVQSTRSRFSTPILLADPGGDVGKPLATRVQRRHRQAPVDPATPALIHQSLDRSANLAADRPATGVAGRSLQPLTTEAGAVPADHGVVTRTRTSVQRDQHWRRPVQKSRSKDFNLAAALSFLGRRAVVGGRGLRGLYRFEYERRLAWPQRKRG